MSRIHIIDNFLPDPEQYRAGALAGEFGSIEFSPTEIFHGIQMAGPFGMAVTERIRARFPALSPTTSFFRRSPKGQREPTYIHSDAMMGDWTGILYLSKGHNIGDGTKFWEHKPTGLRECPLSDVHLFAEDFKDASMWTSWDRCTAYFNRLMMFPSTFFHSRAIVDNFGEGDDARLIQVVFGTGVL